MRSLGLLVVAFTALVAFEGCGSDSNTGKKADAGGLTAAGGGGGSPVTGAGGGMACVASYCPPVNGAPPCCVNNACGYNAGNGCVPSGLKPDAGAH